MGAASTAAAAGVRLDLLRAVAWALVELVAVLAEMAMVAATEEHAEDGKYLRENNHTANFTFRIN